MVNAHPSQLNPASIIQHCQALMAASNSLILAPPPPPPSRTLGELPTDMLTLIFSFCGSFDEGSNSKARLIFSLKLGVVCKNFNEASRSPLLFDHIDFLSYKRPADQMLAAGCLKAMPSFIRVRVNPECFDIVFMTLKKCDMSKLSFFEFFSEYNHNMSLSHQSGSYTNTTLPLLDTQDRDGFQRLPLTSASHKTYTTTRDLGCGEFNFVPASYLVTALCHNAQSTQPLPRNLHLRLDSYDSLRLLAPLSNLTRLSLLGHRLQALDLTSLRSLVTLEIIGAIASQCPSLTSNSLRRLDFSRAGKSFTIDRIACPNLRSIHIEAGWFGADVCTLDSCEWGEGRVQEGRPHRVMDGVWKRTGAWQPVNPNLEWKTHESCMIYAE
jgi:hypothetical protein